MNQLLKLAAYGLGGVGLLIASFVTFSVVTGTPMSEMKAVGQLFPEEVHAETDVEGEGAELPEAEAELEADRRSPRQIYETAASPLGAFALQDPFSAEELRDLEKRLKRKLDEVARHEEELIRRERELEEERQHVEDLYADLQALRTTVLEQSSETEAAVAEVDRDRRVLEEREAQSFKNIASIFEDTKPAIAAKMLVESYVPADAAKVLVNLEDDRVRELLVEIQKILPEEAPQFLKALQAERTR